MEKRKNKLGVVVPYRNRFSQLLRFKSSISKHLTQEGIDFELIVVEQDGAKTFNRGKLLNIGFKIAVDLKCDYVAFHDVDMLPVDVDYSYADYPIHLATKFSEDTDMKRIVFDEYFGGVTLFPTEIFEVINGYSNEYWGWGYEDNDLLARCKLFGVKLDTKDIKMLGGNSAGLRFNGYNSYVRFKNVVDITEPTTFFVSFSPDEIVCDPEKYDDIYSIVSIPGYDLRISYNSYRRYGFEIYDTEGNVIYINSELKPNYKTNISVTIDPQIKTIKMYQDGELIGTKKYEGEISVPRRASHMFLGVGDYKNNENPKYFRGLISSFVIFSGILNDEEITEISNNQFFGLTQNFGKYESSDQIILYYDAKFLKGYRLMDLSGGENDGSIVKCEMSGDVFDEVKTYQIPHRRECEFELLFHKENGYLNNSWKDVTTRYNQLRYHNEVVTGYKNPKDDGLSNCEFKELNKVHVENETHIVVSI